MIQQPMFAYAICGTIFNIKSLYFDYLDFDEQMTQQHILGFATGLYNHILVKKDICD
jgi:hypothetical protein